MEERPTFGDVLIVVIGVEGTVLFWALAIRWLIGLWPD